MKYRSKKENDGTYYIEQSKHGLSWEIIFTGIRGCNVNRLLNKLNHNDFMKSI